MEHMLPEPVVPTPQAPMPKKTATAKSQAQSDTITIKTFGGFEMSKGDRQVAEDDWPTQKALRLFAHLAINRTPITDGALMEMLWPDAPESKARNSLRNARRSTSISSFDQPRRISPVVLIFRGSAGEPSTIVNGGTSRVTRPTVKIDRLAAKLWGLRLAELTQIQEHLRN